MASIRKLGTVLNLGTQFQEDGQHYLGTHFQEDAQYYLGIQFQEDGLHNVN
jgi:hypothetical protein